ncbi:hypothetical protein GCM10007390_01010 [Persicitalea jodogahamensis]|uniref:Uncharacterized protein n=1 Tax=Persicitalea jodogahamensis TaxID=402147 RepID=A0A8J3D0N8_9BACT|nr:hypothetical protein GCM10007390_01010 [Persicitalea jodogahamensis]
MATANFGNQSSARIVIGGTHFWGHADFYVAFPIANLRFPAAESLQKVSYNQGVETGFRVFPWALNAGKLRPFAGMSFKSLNYAQVSNEPNKDYAQVPWVAKMIFPYQAGFAYSGRQFLVQAGVNYQRRTDYHYPVSRTQYGDLTLSPWSFNLGMSYLINTNGGLGSARGAKLIKSRTRQLAATNHLDSWYVGIGPSGTFEISKSEYVKDKYPYLEQSSPGAFIPDIAAGRYFHKPDLNVGISYRRLRYGSSGYNTSLSYSRRSYTLEAYKFLGDYHGFVPFVGPTLAYEDLKFTDKNDGDTDTFGQKKIALGLIFGWDIRISRSETWLLRTNLRYTPNLHLKAEGEKVMFDQMEFNFIQFVWFAGRRNALKNIH